MTAREEVNHRIRGLYGLADASAAPQGDPVRLGIAMLQGGCRLLQLRAKGWSAEAVAEAAQDLLGPCREHGATFIVNDWPDVAARVGADGVHVGQTDGDTAAVRAALGPDRILGRSTNDLAAVPKAMADADYVAFGPVFGTPHLSRPKDVQGLEALAEARTLAGRVPLVAIGGITASRLADVRAAGADAWAVIGAIAKAADPVAASRALLR